MRRGENQQRSPSLNSFDFLSDTRGVSLIEFAFLAPVLCLILAGANDLGGMLYTRYNLDASVSAGANYALVSAASANSTNGAALANTIASIVTNGGSTTPPNSTIVVNNGLTTTTSGAGTPTTSGTPAEADSCYCPTVGSTGVSWGPATTCGLSCSNGTLAGKFVYITANQTYTPLFPSYGFIQNWNVSTNAMVQVQ